MQDYPTNDHDRKSLLYWMEQGLCCNIVPNVDQQLRGEISQSQVQFELKLNQRDLIQGRARRVRDESVEKTTRLARETRTMWHYVKDAISLLDLDPEIADLLGVPKHTSKVPADRTEYWIGAVDVILRGQERAEELGLPEFSLVSYDALEQKRHALHALNTRYNTLRNDLFQANGAVKQERERVDYLIRKLTANLRYLLCDFGEGEQRQIMRRYGFSFRGEAPQTKVEPASSEAEEVDTTSSDEQDNNKAPSPHESQKSDNPEQESAQPADATAVPQSRESNYLNQPQLDAREADLFKGSREQSTSNGALSETIASQSLP